jgi:hypothetical protein
LFIEDWFKFGDGLLSVSGEFLIFVEEFLSVVQLYGCDLIGEVVVGYCVDVSLEGHLAVFVLGGTGDLHLTGRLLCAEAHADVLEGIRKPIMRHTVNKNLIAMSDPLPRLNFPQLTLTIRCGAFDMLSNPPTTATLHCPIIIS